MTCNFLNNAGQDLDNLFAISNSNAGNLGFVTVDGQDLGNRYPNGSLNYAVGYQTSNGTDIGYLRAKTFPISYSSGGNGSVTTNPAYNAVPGQTVRVTATPFSGYTVQSITWNGNSIANNGTFIMPSGPVTIHVTFMIKGDVTFKIDCSLYGTAGAGYEGDRMLTYLLTGGRFTEEYTIMQSSVYNRPCKLLTCYTNFGASEVWSYNKTVLQTYLGDDTSNDLIGWTVNQRCRVTRLDTGYSLDFSYNLGHYGHSLTRNEHMFSAADACKTIPMKVQFIG